MTEPMEHLLRAALPSKAHGKAAVSLRRRILRTAASRELKISRDWRAAALLAHVEANKSEANKLWLGGTPPLV